MQYFKKKGLNFWIKCLFQNTIITWFFSSVWSNEKVSAQSLKDKIFTIMNRNQKMVVPMPLQSTNNKTKRTLKYFTPLGGKWGALKDDKLGPLILENQPRQWTNKLCDNPVHKLSQSRSYNWKLLYKMWNKLIIFWAYILRRRVLGCFCWLV